MDTLSPDLLNDLEVVAQIPVISAILQVVCTSTGMGFAAVARVTDKKWVACAVRDEISFGLKPGGELLLESTICYEISQHHQEVVINHVSQDPQWAAHHTPAQYGLESYISFPIMRKDGTFYGTLCCIDPKPAVVNTPEIRNTFRLFSDLIAFHLQAAEDITHSKKLLAEEREVAELREQFIAILGHDLRNPVGAIKNISQLLQRGKPDEKTLVKLANVLQNSTHRMSGLIDNIMDFTRARLGNGLSLDLQPVALEETLSHVVHELQLIWPEKTVEVDFALTTAFLCDEKRIAQLFSNILGNAMTYSKGNEPILVYASSADHTLEIRVTNKGNPIPDHIAKSIFEPFSRGINHNDKRGLGLGLFISSEIAKAHAGQLQLTSTDDLITLSFVCRSVA